MRTRQTWFHRTKSRLVDVYEAKGLAERISEEVDKLNVQQFRVELADTKDTRCRRSRARQRLFSIAKHGLGTVP